MPASCGEEAGKSKGDNESVILLLIDSATTIYFLEVRKDCIVVVSQSQASNCSISTGNRSMTSLWPNSRVF